jgi:WD40 repeat protein
MRRTLVVLVPIPFLVISLVPERLVRANRDAHIAESVGPQVGDSVSRVSPEANSAREELAHLQKQTGLTVSVVAYEGVGILDFEKRAFTFRTLGFKGNGIAGAVSRDGTTVALFNTLSNPYSVLVLQPGMDLVREFPGVVAVPACWSNDNLRLVLIRGESEIQILDLASSVLQTLPIADALNEGPINAQCWSPDGKQIVYASTDGYVCVYDLEKHNSTKLAKGTDPTWPPEANWIAYRGGATYRAIRPSGGGQKKLFHKTRAVSPLYWSPDSRFVLYIHEDFFALDVEFYHLMVRRLADGSEESVADVPNVASGNIQWIQNPELIKWVEAGPRTR